MCSVCSCFRQMTCWGPQGLRVILHPSSPTAPADGLLRTFFSCVFSICLHAGMSTCGCEKPTRTFFQCVYLCSRLSTLKSLALVFVCACMWNSGKLSAVSMSSVCNMLRREMGSRKVQSCKSSTMLDPPRR